MIRRNLLPLLTLSALQLADGGTTYAALAQGASEVNPVASLAFGLAGVVTSATVFKLALLVWATIFACFSRLARPFLLAAVAAYALVVFNNLTPFTMRTNDQPTVSLAPVHQAQTPYFVSDEDRFLNRMMIRAYNSGDTVSLGELLQYWQDAHSTAL